MSIRIKRLRLACYTTNISMALIANLSPLLFLTFRSLYGISYSLLGMLVLINFVTQLSVDLVFSFFSHKFNIPKTVKLTPVLAVVGIIIYAVFPFVFPDSVYSGLVIGTVIFSASGGLAEVLISPIIASLPSDDPDREMSRLHSIYAWGVMFVVVFISLFLLLFGKESWQWMALILSSVPLISALLFSKADVPKMETPEKTSGALKMLKNKSLRLCIAAIFLGGASECTMSQWSSGYLEQALGIPKVWGDVFGVALFAVMLGLARTLYAGFGKNIVKVLFFSAIGTTVCYFVAAVSVIPAIGLLACALTGFTTGMLWPGCLIVSSERFPNSGVFIFAMMAAGGDLGASVGPQLIGVITDAVISHPDAAAAASKLMLSTEQLGMKLGMLSGMIFPLCAVPLYFCIMRNKKTDIV